MNILTSFDFLPKLRANDYLVFFRLFKMESTHGLLSELLMVSIFFSWFVRSCYFKLYTSRDWSLWFRFSNLILIKPYPHVGCGRVLFSQSPALPQVLMIPREYLVVCSRPPHHPPAVWTELRSELWAQISQVWIQAFPMEKPRKVYCSFSVSITK